MGLAEPRKRLKLSKDPNNTTWTKNTTGFGHKLMKSQGWQPGDYLGAKDAPHAELYTEANASHIRVVLKDDNLGIGAKKGSGLEQGECVGLDVFQNLLGRLNGRDEDELAQEQKSREDLKRAIYTERKWGSTRFISGGFLIGDKIQDLIDGEAERIRQLAVDSSSDPDNSSNSNSASESEETSNLVLTKQKILKKSKKVIDPEVSDATAVEPKNGKTKSKKKRKLAEAEAEVEASEDAMAKIKKSKKHGRIEAGEDRAKSKDSKRKSKKEKGKKSKKMPDEDLSTSSSVNESRSSTKSKPKKSKSETATPDLAEAKPAPLEIVSRPILLGGRHAVRSRNIAQKRLAAMDSASLNEIFMIKG